MFKRLQLQIRGRVQGVFFRDSARQQAEKLDLTGLVKNEIDGVVTIVAEGEEKKLKEFIKWCYNGPKLAKVQKIDIEWQKAKGEFEKFKIER